MREIQELTHARMEPAIAGCPGLFIARRRQCKGMPGPAACDALDVIYQLGDIELRMLSAHRPRPADLLLLVVLLALAGPGRCEPGEKERALVDALACEPAPAAAGTIVVRTNRARLLEECGVSDGGSTREALIDSLIRLSGLMALVSHGSQKVSMHLLSFTIDTATGEISVALSPRLSSAILGGRHIRLELPELRELGEHARVLYVRLCNWVDPGRTRRIGVDALVQYLWAAPPARGSLVRKRVYRVRRAMAELAQLHGWHVEPDRRAAQYSITRPPVKTGTEAGISGTLPVKTGTPESAISV